jgi:hypothetical protein
MLFTLFPPSSPLRHLITWCAGLVLTSALSTTAGGVLAGEVISVQARRQGSAVQVTTQAIVRAPQELIWQTLTDYDHLAEFVPDLISSRVIERQGSTVTVEQAGKAHLWFFTYAIDVLQWSGLIEPALPVPTAVTLPLLRGNIARQFEGMVREIERREARRTRVGQQ